MEQLFHCKCGCHHHFAQGGKGKNIGIRSKGGNAYFFTMWEGPHRGQGMKWENKLRVRLDFRTDVEYLTYLISYEFSLRLAAFEYVHPFTHCTSSAIDNGYAVSKPPDTTITDVRIVAESVKC